jgi:uncharacterized protein (TIGR02217 family)
MAAFQLVKAYGASFSPWSREIKKPVGGTILVAVDGVSQAEGADFTCDAGTGIVTFAPGAIPGIGAAITAGFQFDVPVRFDSDRIEISLDGFRHGSIPNIPVVEIRM